MVTTLRKGPGTLNKFSEVEVTVETWETWFKPVSLLVTPRIPEPDFSLGLSLRVHTVRFKTEGSRNGGPQ